LNFVWYFPVKVRGYCRGAVRTLRQAQPIQQRRRRPGQQLVEDVKVALARDLPAARDYSQK
jgi:hypothetical protein